jgi:hypothetical protein
MAIRTAPRPSPISSSAFAFAISTWSATSWLTRTSKASGSSAGTGSRPSSSANRPIRSTSKIEAGPAEAHDDPQPAQVVVGVLAIAVGLAGRRRQDAFALIETDRPTGRSRRSSQVRDVHIRTLHVEPSSTSRGFATRLATRRGCCCPVFVCGVHCAVGSVPGWRDRPPAGQEVRVSPLPVSALPRPFAILLSIADRTRPSRGRSFGAVGGLTSATALSLLLILGYGVPAAEAAPSRGYRVRRSRSDGQNL